VNGSGAPCSRRPVPAFFVLFAALACCHSRCSGLGALRRGETPGEALPAMATDCPDGLARCRGGIVEVSRLAAIERPCRAPPAQCLCPWARVASCPGACVVDDVEVVLAPSLGPAQLCAPDEHAAPIARPTTVLPPAASCEGALYRCAQGVVAPCRERSAGAVCARGCIGEGATVDEGVPVTVEQAAAILCVR